MSEPALSDTMPDLERQMQDTFRRMTARQPVAGRSSAGERINKLKRLHACLIKYRREMQDALVADFHKPPTETDISELGLINTEIRHTIRHLRSWMTPKKVSTPLMLIGTRSEIRYEPKGVCLIISPWNYPIMLTLCPLVSAIAAGNCVVLKPSEFTPNATRLMKKIVAELFSPDEVAIFEGDAAVAQSLLALPFNHIYFTGSPTVGKIVMAAAAKTLASVTLELGGKSPVVVDETADLELAASRLVWLKAMNGGQICIANDYVLVHESVHDVLVQKVVKHIERMYGNSLEVRSTNPDLSCMIHDRHFQRMQSLVDDARQRGAHLFYGGGSVAASRYFDITLLTNVPDTARVMEEEIFGPLLPFRKYREIDEAIAYINAKPSALSMYIFSGRKKNVARIIAGTRNGNLVVNDCGIQFYNNYLPFGGVNNSGIGRGHGEFGFLEFSNQRAVVYQNRIYPHTTLFLPPYKKNKLANWILEGVIRWF